MKTVFCAAALAVAAIMLPQADTAVAASAKCNSIEAQFRKSVRPRFLRVVNRDRSRANWYNSTLKRLKSGRNPTRAEIDRAYRMLLADCKSAKSVGKCRAFANDLVVVSRNLYSYNRRWSNAGCPGSLGD